jgi:hypothetical protein
MGGCCRTIGSCAVGSCSWTVVTSNVQATLTTTTRDAYRHACIFLLQDLRIPRGGGRAKDGQGLVDQSDMAPSI